MSAFRICVLHFCGFDILGAIGKNVCRIFFATGSMQRRNIKNLIIQQEHHSQQEQLQIHQQVQPLLQKHFLPWHLSRPSTAPLVANLIALVIESVVNVSLILIAFPVLFHSSVALSNSNRFQFR